MSVFVCACLDLLTDMFVCVPICWHVECLKRVRGKVSAATQSVSAPAPFHCGPASETEHEAQGIEVH